MRLVCNSGKRQKGIDDQLFATRQPSLICSSQVKYVRYGISIDSFNFDNMSRNTNKKLVENKTNDAVQILISSNN